MIPGGRRFVGTYRNRDAGIGVFSRKCDTRVPSGGRVLSEGVAHSMNRRHALRMMAASTLFSLPALASTPRKSRRDEPDVRSNTVLVLDRSERSVIFSRRADVALPIASITKLMTALVVLDADQP